MAAKELIAPNDRMSDLADNIGSISNLPQMWQTRSRFAYDMLKTRLTALCARAAGRRSPISTGPRVVGSGGRACMAFNGEKTPSRDRHHRKNDRVARLCMSGNLGRSAMKTLLVGVAFAIGMVFASQAFALPCPNGTWQNGHFICASYDE
jgi:hypothetical protein